MVSKSIIEMAKEAGIYCTDRVRDFAELVRADEREACKAACQAIAEHHELVADSRAEAAADECVIAIEARGNT